MRLLRFPHRHRAAERAAAAAERQLEHARRQRAESQKVVDKSRELLRENGFAQKVRLAMGVEK